MGEEYFEHHPYPENIFWLIEYADASLKKDLDIKTQIYAEAGILEYWVVNLKTMELMVFKEPTENGYQQREILTEGQIHPVAFADVALAVKSFIRR